MSPEWSQHVTQGITSIFVLKYDHQHRFALHQINNQIKIDNEYSTNTKLYIIDEPLLFIEAVPAAIGTAVIRIIHYINTSFIIQLINQGKNEFSTIYKPISALKLLLERTEVVAPDRGTREDLHFLWR